MRGSTLFGIGLLGLVLLTGLAVALWKTARVPDPDRPVENSAPMNESPVADSPATDTAKSSLPAEPAPQSSPVDSESLQFPSWPKPDFAFVVTGEMHGYFEPCGCTANQLGGMNRRADLFKQVRDLGWTVHGIDVGGLPRRTGRQAQVKFETTVAAMRDLGYIATGLGPEELRLDPGYLISQHVVDSDNPLYFLSANLVFYGVPDLGTPLPSRIFELNGRKVGITSVMSDRVRKEVIPDRAEGSTADITWSDPAEALNSVLADFEQHGVDFRILLSQGFDEESVKSAKQFPAFDLVVTTRGHGEGDPSPEVIGRTRLLRVGNKGKHAAVVGVYPKETETPIRYELVTLTGELFGESAAMIQHMKVYQDRLREEQIALSENEVAHPSGAGFVGAAKCGECHTKAYEIWEKTPHAHAFESLDPTSGRPGHERLNGVARLFDPECLSCHVTGWDPQEYVRFRTGFLNQEFASTESDKLLQSLLAGNQCENCHGPGSRHVELIDAGNTEAAIKEVQVTLETARESMCVKCHDVDNSPKFDFDKYWKDVEHYGKD